MGVKVKQHKGAWWVFINHHGKRKAKRIGESKRAAQQVAEKIQAKLALGQFEGMEPKKAQPPTLSAYAQGWLETYANVHLKPATCHRYAEDLKLHVLPTLGSKLLPDITRQDTRELVAAKRAAGLAWKTVRNLLCPLRAMLNEAVDDGLLAANPATRMGKFNKRPAERQADINPMTRDELRLYLATARQHFCKDYPFLLTLARAGLRLGEALALQWGDLDWHGRFLEVRRAYCHTSKQVQTPKNGKTRRVDMSQQLTETLRLLLIERKKETLRKGWGEMPPWVFVSATGSMLDGDNIRHRVHGGVLKKAGLRHMRLHDLRHTFASHLIQNGESLAYVKEQLGHHSIQITVDTYGHLVPGGNRQAVDRLDDLDETPIEATNRNLYATATDNAVTEEVLSA